MSVANPGRGHKICVFSTYNTEYKGRILSFGRGLHAGREPKWKTTFFVDTFCHPPTPYCVCGFVTDCDCGFVTRLDRRQNSGQKGMLRGPEEVSLGASICPWETSR